MKFPSFIVNDNVMIKNLKRNIAYKVRMLYVSVRVSEREEQKTLDSYQLQTATIDLNLFDCL